MKLTESMNICYASDRVHFAIKMNVKETFMEDDSFAYVYVVNGLQSEYKRSII